MSNIATTIKSTVFSSAQRSLRRSSGLKSKVHGLKSSVFPNPNRNRQSRGFTLLELLVVIAIIMILAGLILTALNVGRNRARDLAAKRDIKQLKTAWEAYYADYSGFPDPAQIGGNSLTNGYMVTGKDVIQILRGRANYNGQNPRKMTYMDFHEKSTVFSDPWGNMYRIALDVDNDDSLYDGKVNVPGNNNLRQSVAAWSAGKDGADGTDDDVRSWQ